jgi:hypothetical protein
MPLMGFNTPSPSSHVARDDETSKPRGKLFKVDKDHDAAASDGLLNNFPLVRLDVDAITDSIAGGLATSLLGHVLFLKNQIPL